ncbi:MAG: IS110 family transposase [Bryobacteraceae bacterium]|jgi:transposase
MPAELTSLDFTGQTIYVGLDVGRRSWAVSIYTDCFEHKTFVQRPDPEALVRYLHKHFPQATYRSVYEAGYCGLWPHQALTALGVDCIVVHPVDVPTTGKERKNRTDRVDARKLARTLRSGQLQGIYVPSREAQEDRCLVRMHTLLVKKQTRCKNQILALLSFFGVLIPDEIAESRWSRHFINFLTAVPFASPSGQQSLELLLDELSFVRQQIARHTREVRALASSELYRQQVALLRTVPGISVHSAMVMLTELVELERFKSLDELAGYFGLVPGEDSSGDKEVVTGLTSRRNAFLRHLIIECSWMAVRKDPALMQSFNQLTKRMRKTQAIVRIARKLLARIRFVLRKQQPYVPCVVA